MSELLEYRNVCEIIVKNDLCIGCGVCAGVCPTQVLEMQFNDYGEYVALETKAGCLECGLCLRVCPFGNQSENEDTLALQSFGGIPGIQHRSETGYYLECFVGYSKVNNNRAKGASGGIARWLLESLLENGYADYVVCVTASQDSEKLFQFAVLDDVQAIRTISKSAYYPVELSGVIQRILDVDGRYVVTGLPCFLKALRLAMHENQLLRKRIVTLVGLVCGKMKSKLYVEYLCVLGGGNPNYIVAADFRVKDPLHSITDFGFQAKWVKDSEIAVTRKVFFSELAGEVWPTYFTPNPCNYCDDIFAEVADVVCMDAWLSEYVTDPKGNNLVLCRSSEVRDLLIEGKQRGDLSISAIEIGEVIQSQAGVIRKKREELAHRLYLDGLPSGEKYCPKKRVLLKRLPSVAGRVSFMLRERMRLKSREVFYQKRSVQAVEAALFVERGIYGIVERNRVLFKAVLHKLKQGKLKIYGGGFDG